MNPEVEVTLDQVSPDSARVCIRVTLVLVLAGWKLEDLVGQFGQAFTECARRSLERVLTLLDEWLLQQKPAGHRVTHVDHGRTVRCSLGVLRLVHRQMKKPGGGHYSPLLQWLGLGPRQRVLKEMLKPVVAACLWCSFRKAVRVTGASVSVAEAWREFQRAAAEIHRRRESAVEYFEAGDPSASVCRADFAIVMEDGIYFKGRRTPEERAQREVECMKARAEGKRAPRRSKGREAKAARLVMFKRQPDGSVKTIGPFVYVGTASSDKFQKDCAAHFNAVAGLHLVPYIQVLTDGCGWGRKFCDNYPGRAFWCIDWWHLWKAIKKGCRLQEGLYEEVWGLLNVEKLDEALKVLEAALQGAEAYQQLCRDKLDQAGQPAGYTPLRRSAERRLEHGIEDLRDLITYLRNNRDGIYGAKNFPPDLAGVWMWGSGPVERLQGVMIGYRMKGQGKTWSVAGADHMLAALMEAWDDPSAGEEILRLLGELEEWEELCSRPNVHQEACGQGRDRSHIGGLPAVHGKRTGTGQALRGALRGGFPLGMGVAS